MTKKQKQAEEKIKQAIVDGHRRGVCDSEGRSIRGADGHLTARPRVLGSTAKKYRI